jgi:hypothetical protein
VPNVEQELFTLPEQLSSPSVFGGVRVALSLVFCVMWYKLILVTCHFIRDLIGLKSSGYLYRR